MLLPLLALLTGSSDAATDHVRLPNGIRVDLVAISDPSMKRSWSADGKPLPKYVHWPGYAAHGHNHSDEPALNSHVRFVTIRFDLPKPDRKVLPSVRFQGSLSGKEWGSITWPDFDKRLCYYQAQLFLPEPSPLMDNVRVGIADGAWKTVGRQWFGSNPHREGVQFAADPQPMRMSLKDKAEPSGTHVYYTLPANLQNDAIQMIAYGQDGNPLEPSGAMTLNGKTLMAFRFVAPPYKVARVDLQARPYQWATFNNVRFSGR